MGRKSVIRAATRRWGPLVLAALFCLAPFQTAIALDPAKAITQYVHSVWVTDNGLPQNSVMRVVESKDGYLWVGTQNGIGRFDGVRFTVFDKSNTPALRDNYVSDLVEDRKGTLWIATSHGGLTSFQDGRFAHVDGIGDRAALTLAADADGSVWVGGTGGLAHVMDSRVVRSYTTADGLSGDTITRLVVARDKSLWIGTAGGLDRMAGGRIQAYTVKDGLPNNHVTDLHLGPDDTLWVKTQNSELTRRVNGRFEPWKVEGVAGTGVRDMLEDRHGNLWIASATEGLVRVRGQQVSRYTIKDGLSSDEVVCLYEDRDGNLWAGTNEGGLDRFRDGNLTTYAKEEGLSADRTHSVIEDSAGDMWITTSAGLNQLHDNRVRVFTTSDGLPSNDVLSLWEDHEHSLLIGTFANGLARMTRGRFEQGLSTRDGMPAYYSSAIREDSAHQLWLSTRGGGLVRYADGRISVYSKANGLASDSLFAMAEGANGTIWIGTSDGLSSIQDGHIQSYPAKDGPANAWIFTLYFDSRNVLWIGTLERGLFRFENGHFTKYTTHQGLPDDTIGNILEDSETNLWIGSNKGISRLSRHDLDAVADGTSKTMEPIVFGKADGMKTLDLNTGTQPNGWRAHDGRLWFPTTRGVVVVDPAHLSFDDRPLSPRIEEMVADEVHVDIAAAVRLAPGTRRLDIRYTAPNLSSPERTQFRYRLEGFDEQWVTGGNPRVADYTNLSPGHYTFRVGARTERGNWSDREATLGFDLRPQFYQAWWFRILCGLAAISLMAGIYRLRVGWLHARAAVLEERQRIASEIHDSLAQGLSGIVFQAEAALMSMTRAPDMTATHVTSARDLAQSSLDDARYSVWNLSPPVLDQKSLPESLTSMARQLARGRVEQLDIHSSGTAWAMRPEAKHHVVMIAQEAVSNAIQHGNARTVSIDLTFAAEALLLVVSDDGIGFAPEAGERQRARGYGMRNMHHRAERLGATLEVASEPGKGARVCLSIPRLGKWARFWRSLRGTGIARIDG
jgi:ligand-binding sensor domain-containing protein/signal transduction histidine kinase